MAATLSWSQCVNTVQCDPFVIYYTLCTTGGGGWGVGGWGVGVGGWGGGGWGGGGVGGGGGGVGGVGVGGIFRSTAHTVLDGLFPNLAQMITSMRRTLTYFVACNDLSPRPISSRLNNCDLAYIMDYIYVTQIQPKRGRCVMYHVQVKKSKCQGHPGCFAVLVDHWSTVSSFVLVLVELALCAASWQQLLSGDQWNFKK